MAQATLSNDQIRANFLAVATERSQKLPRQTYADGSNIVFTLPKAGFARYVILDFQGTLTITGSGGAGSLSPRAPFNVFKNIAFEDYMGITRISSGGYGLYEREITSKFGFDPGANGGIPAPAYDNQLLEYAINASGNAPVAGSYPWQFSVIVPIALHDNTTEGSFPFTLPEGDNTITISTNSFVGANNDFVFKQTTAGFTFSLAGTIGCTYYYYDVPKGTQLPLEDFALIHEIREIKQSDNINAGVEKTFTLPTGRTYMQLIQDVVLNDSLDTTDVNRVRLLIDGNTPTMDEDLLPYLIRTKRTYGRSLPAGTFYFDFWRKPWTPSQYGSIQTGLTLSSSATTSGNTYTRVLLESIYRTASVQA